MLGYFLSDKQLKLAVDYSVQTLFMITALSLFLLSIFLGIEIGSFLPFLFFFVIPISFAKLARKTSIFDEYLYVFEIMYYKLALIGLCFALVQYTGVFKKAHDYEQIRLSEVKLDKYNIYGVNSEFDEYVSRRTSHIKSIVDVDLRNDLKYPCPDEVRQGSLTVQSKIKFLNEFMVNRLAYPSVNCHEKKLSNAELAELKEDGILFDRDLQGKYLDSSSVGVELYCRIVSSDMRFQADVREKSEWLCNDANYSRLRFQEYKRDFWKLKENIDSKNIEIGEREASGKYSSPYRTVLFLGFWPYVIAVGISLRIFQVMRRTVSQQKLPLGRFR